MAQYYQHLNAHAFDSNCPSCANGLKVFDRLLRWARPASIGFSISVWAPALDKDRSVHTDPGWVVQWARCVEWDKARACFESLSGLQIITGGATWDAMSDNDRLQKREVGLFLDTVSHYGHVDRFQLEMTYRKTDA